jgi:hypothetical protein
VWRRRRRGGGEGGGGKGSVQKPLGLSSQHITHTGLTRHPAAVRATLLLSRGRPGQSRGPARLLPSPPHLQQRHHHHRRQGGPSSSCTRRSHQPECGEEGRGGW